MLTNQEILDAMQWRYAVKQYDTNKPLEEEKLQTILEVGRLSASSFGIQPWIFLVINNKDLQNTLLPHAYNQPQITSASHLIVLCGRNTLDNAYVNEYIDYIVTQGTEKEKLSSFKNMLLGQFENLRQQGKEKEYADNQVYIALGSMLTAAAALHIDATPIGGFDPEAFDRILKLEEKGFHSTVVLALGYRDPIDPAGQKTKIRRPKEKIIFYS